MVHWRAGGSVAPLGSFAVSHESTAARRTCRRLWRGRQGRQRWGQTAAACSGGGAHQDHGAGSCLPEPEATRPVAQSIHRHRKARPALCFRIPLYAMPPWLCCQGKKPIFSCTLPITSEKVIVPSSAYVSGLLECQFTEVSLLESYFASPSLQVN